VNKPRSIDVASVLRATLVKIGETRKILGFSNEAKQHGFLRQITLIALMLLAIPAGFEPATLRVEI
jgi:hypothetical protein